MIPIFSDISRVSVWCYVRTNTVKGIFVVGKPPRSVAGAEEWELLLLEVQALLCLCVTLWYIRLVYDQLMKWPAWHLAHAKGWALSGRVQMVQGGPPSMQVMGKAIARLQCSSVHRQTYSSASSACKSLLPWVIINHSLILTHRTVV